jgi:hypothetical protein
VDSALTSPKECVSSFFVKLPDPKRVIMKVYWFLFLMLSLFIPSVYASTAFTDAQAKQYFEELMDKGCKKIPLGPVFAMTGPAQSIPERIRMGIDRLANVEDLDYFNALASRGILRVETVWASPDEPWVEIRVAVTPKGESLKGIWKVPQEDGWFCVKAATVQVTSIARNEITRKSLDVYRVIMLTWDAEWTPEMLIWKEMMEESVSKQRKGIFLLKHDPFLSKWVLITFDNANLEEELSTSRVADELSKR